MTAMLRGDGDAPGGLDFETVYYVREYQRHVEFHPGEPIDGSSALETARLQYDLHTCRAPLTPSERDAGLRGDRP